MDPLRALDPIQGGSSFGFGMFGFVGGAAADRTSCCSSAAMPMPTSGCCGSTKQFDKSLRQFEKTTTKLLKLLFRLMDGKPAKKGKNKDD